MSDSKPSNKRTFSVIGVIAVFGIVVALNYIARSVPLAADFTENRVHTLSDGTRRILEKIDTPVSIKYYVTQDADVMPSFLLTRSREFEAFLRQYVRASDGNVTIEKYDPQPDTDEEDAARLEGVQANPGPRGDVYFGCAIKSLDQKVILPYIPAISDELQEYELTRAISQVASGTKTVVGVMSSFEVAGGFGGGNPMMGGRPEPAWVFYEQLGQDYEVEIIAEDAEEIPENVSVLLLLHPAGITESAMFAVDQFLLGGGKLAVFLDPMSITARMQTPAPNPMQRNQPPAGPPTSSNLEKLLSSWGYKFNSNEVVADINYKTPLQGGVQAPGVLTFPPDALNRDDVLTSKLNDMLMLFAGEFTGEPVAGLKKEILVSSSTASQNVDAAGVENNHAQIQQEFKPSGEEKVLALRLSGTFETAFPDGKPGVEESEVENGEDESDGESEDEEPDSHLKKSEKEGAVVLVGDTDFLYDQFCAQVMNLMGQRLVSMRNGNLPLFLNMMEQLSGDTDLISIRSRASSRRPFTRVNEMEEEANRKIRDESAKLQDEVAEANKRLSEIQANVDPSQKQILSAALRSEQDKLREKVSATQTEQRKLQKEARAELNWMITKIKLLNIVVIPLLVAIGGIVVFVSRRARTSAR